MRRPAGQRRDGQAPPRVVPVVVGPVPRRILLVGRHDDGFGEAHGGGDEVALSGACDGSSDVAVVRDPRVVLTGDR